MRGSADSERLRVLVVTGSYPPEDQAGAARATRTAVAGLRAAGCEVLVLTQGRPTGRREGVWRIAAGRVGFARRLVSCGPRIVEEFAPDVIDLHTPLTPLILRRLDSRTAAPVVSTVHGPTHTECAIIRPVRVDERLTLRPTVSERVKKHLKGPLMIRLDGLRTRRSERMLFVSRSAADRWAERFGAAEKATVVPNAVDAEVNRPLPEARAALRDRLGLCDAEVVLFAGVFMIRKGPDVLLKAFARLAERRPAARLVVAGGGFGYERPLRALAERLGVAGRVVWPGWVPQEELPAWYNAADVVTTPSRYETFCLVLAEAMACARAVVASAAGGMPEVVGDADCGLLTPPGNPDALAESLEALLADPDRRERMGAAARRRMVERFSLERVTALRLEAYRAAMGTQ